MFIIFPIGFIAFSAWWIFHVFKQAGKPVGFSIGAGVGGALFWLVLTAIIPTIFAGPWKSMLRQGDDAPVIFGMMLICAVIVFLSGVALRSLLAKN